MSALDVDQVRKNFPALQRDFGGQPVVFADAPGGTQVPQTVVDAMTDYMVTSNANEQGAFTTSAETDSVIDAARDAGADILGCEPDEVVFGPNMTTLAFALSRALARTLRSGDEVVVSRLDHDANIAPWVAAAEDAGARVKWIDFDPSDCTIDLESLDRAVSDRTRICAFTLASNAVGTVTPAADIVRRVREACDALVIGDAVHYAPHRSIDVRDLDFDFLFCSPYKFWGPHLGVMYGKGSLLEEIRPYKVRPAPDEPPACLQTGTRSHEALAGLTACVDYIASLTDGEGPRRRRVTAALQAIAEHEASLARLFIGGVARRDGVMLYGINDAAKKHERTSTFAIRIDREAPLASATRLGEEGIFVWHGNYYALTVMERLGLEHSGGAVRIGFCHYHTPDEVDRVLDALRG
ncbi:MAG: cysteine desulfurase-like protein [Actinomycetota bacterium]|nr:cysteine desulfurase-like protein [Actinomycetota bacterium]